jgi:hypothetical protein
MHALHDHCSPFAMAALVSGDRASRASLISTSMIVMAPANSGAQVLSSSLKRVQ